MFDQIVAFGKSLLDDAGAFVARNILWFGAGALVLVGIGVMAL